jgi:hypothetical protein
MLMSLLLQKTSAAKLTDDLPLIALFFMLVKKSLFDLFPAPFALSNNKFTFFINMLIEHSSNHFHTASSDRTDLKLKIAYVLMLANLLIA